MNLKEFAQDGGAKSPFNQQDAMKSLLEDCQRARCGWSRPYCKVSSSYRRNYDNINWEMKDERNS